MAYRRRSRLLQKEAGRSLRRAALFGLLTLLLIFGLVFLGIPALIRVAIFLGNLRSSSLPVESQDTFPPVSPRLEPLPEATNQGTITVRGFTEEGATVEIFLGGISTKKVIAETDGTFVAGEVQLTLGRNDVVATATDKAGNVSQESKKMIVIYDTEPPFLTIEAPTEKTLFSGEENKANVRGQTEEDASVTINDHFVVINPEGKFEYALPLSEGENLILVTAIDKAENKTEEEIKVSYQP